MTEFHIGFSGSREGVTDRQRFALQKLLETTVSVYPDADLFAHHGDCLGADEEFDTIMRDLGAHMVIHPPEKDYMQAFCYQPGDTQLEEKDYLERDEDIVEASDELVFCPNTFRERKRSGTWTTVRYTRNHMKSGVIVFPDATFETIWSHNG